VPVSTTFAGNILNQDKVALPRLTGGQSNFDGYPGIFGLFVPDSFVSGYCSACCKCASHDAAIMVGVKVGKHAPEAVFYPEYRYTHEDLLYLHNALYLTYYIYYGVEYDLLYNSGWTADNISQQRTYTIVDTSLSDPVLSSNQLRLRGDNPRHLQTGDSQPNPDWYGNGGDEGNRLITVDSFHCLPIGSMGVFHFPSVLRLKQLPCLTKVEDVTAVGDGEYEFIATLSNACSYAKYPDDQKYGDVSEYSITFYYYKTTPMDWPDIQPSPNTGWTRETVSLESGDLVEGVYTISDRILYPGLVDVGGLTLFGCVVRDGHNRYPVSFGSLSVSTQQSGGSWTVQIDFSSITSFDTIELMYFREASGSDDVWFRTRSSCTNSKREWSGSYTHDTNNYCAAYIGSDGNPQSSVAPFKANFCDECWQPECPNFTLTPVFDCNDPAWLNRFWNSVDMVMSQGIPGCSNHRNFSIDVVSMPSLRQVAGFYETATSTGVGHATKYLYHDAACGQLEESSTSLYLRHGALWGRDGNGEEFDMADMLNSRAGLFPEDVSGYETKKGQLGQTYDDDIDATGALRRFPFHNTGETHLYQYTTSNHGYCMTQGRRENIQLIISGFNENDYLTDDQELDVADIRSLY